MTDLAFATLTELAAALRRGDTTSAALTELYLARIAEHDPKLHAYVAVYEDAARAAAEAADLQRRTGLPLPPLHGLPIALKDLLDIEDFVTTAGSAVWTDRRSTTTATVVERLLAAGMIVLGKTHMVEFAFGGWGTNPRLGTPWNPWDLEIHRVPGGSSSGSGVAVAAGLAPAALGSDTGGSVRIPAALCGITGLKTTTGLVSLHGAVPLSTLLDSIGPMTRSVEDAALLTAAMAGPDPRDPRSLAAPIPDYRPALAADSLRGLRIAVLPEDQFPLPLHPDVARAWREAQGVLRELGAELAERPFPMSFEDLMIQNGRLIAAEAYALHRDYIEDESLPIGPWVRRRTLGGRDISGADYVAAREAQRQAGRQFRDWLGDDDALLTPTLPMPAVPLDEVDENLTPLAAFTRAGNYLDICGLSIPAGFSAQGLPVGMQLMAKPYREDILIRIGHVFQKATDWHRRRPL